MSSDATPTTIRKARRALTISFVVNGIMSGTLVSRLPDIRQGLHLSDAQLGSALVFTAAAAFLSMPWVSKMVARLGSGPSNVWGGTALGVVYPLMGLLINLQVQWAAFFVFGVCMVWQDVSMNSHAVALERVADRRFMTVLHASWSIGTLLAGAIGGVVSQLGLPVFAHFALASTLLVVSLWSVRSSLLPASVDRHEPEAKGPRRRRLRRPQIQLIFVALGLIGLFEQIGEGAGSDWGGVLARTHFHTNHLVGTVPYFAFTLMMVTGRLFGDRLATRFSTRALLTASGLLVATGLGVGMAMNTMVGEVLAWLCLGLGSSTVIPLLFSATGRIAHARAATSSLSAASAIAFVTAIAYSGGLFGPPLVGFVADLVGLRHALWLPGVLGALYALGSFAILRDDHDTTGTEGVLDHAL